jgi:purine-cytosine permease-like protein
MLIVLIASIWMAIAGAGGWEAVDRGHVTVMPMSMAFAIGLTIGSWINGTIKSGDFTRFSRRASGVFAGPFLGLWLCNTLVMFAGVVAANISEIARTEALLGQIIVPAMAVGGAFFAVTIAMYWLTTINTCPPTAYSSALDLANVFWRRKTFLVIPVSVIALVLAVMIEYVAGAAAAMAAWLPFVTHVMPTYGGIIIADFWLVNRGRVPPIGDLVEKAKPFLVNPIAYITWVAAGLINWWTTTAMEALGPGAGFVYGIPGVNGLVAAILIYWGLMSLTKQRWSYWTKWIPRF